MSLYKRPDSRIWWAAIRLPDGGRVCRSSGTANRQEAQEWLDRTRADLWRIRRLGERPTYTWQDAVVRWCNEKALKATALEDRAKFQWLGGYLCGRLLHTITRDEIQAIGEAKARESSRATANRYLALVRAVLKRAAGPWQWIEKAPAVTLYSEAKRRVRWLTKEEAKRLLHALPPHQRQLARFALATGLRHANVLGMRWSDVDLDRRTAWVNADEAKGGTAIGVPLNDEAIAVLCEEIGKHHDYVFTFRRRPLARANTKAWKNALRRARIDNFRWHDLRHVWATWHVMAGTTLGELQELGAWKTEAMVRRYAHFAPEQLRKAADRLATFWSTGPKEAATEASQVLENGGQGRN
jgi:integrase